MKSFFIRVLRAAQNRLEIWIDRRESDKVELEKCGDYSIAPTTSGPWMKITRIQENND